MLYEFIHELDLKDNYLPPTLKIKRRHVIKSAILSGV